MQRSSPALFSSPSFCPSKKRSFLRREPNVADDNDDTQQLLLAACREGGCGHRHHSYTSNSSNHPHSVFNNNLTNRSQRGGGRTQQRSQPELQNRSSNNTEVRNWPSNQQELQNQSTNQQLSNQQHHQSQSSQHNQLAHQASRQPPEQKKGSGKQKPLQKEAPPQLSQSSAPHLPQPKEHVTPTMRQCSAPTPLYPTGPVHALGTVHQQHSFPEWSRSPHKVLPLFQHASNRSPPLTAAAAASSPSRHVGEDLKHPVSTNTNVLVSQGGDSGCEGHSNGNTQVAVPLGHEPAGWVMHGQAKAPAFLNNNNTISTTIITDDDMDSQGRSHTPDSPLRSGDDEGMGEDDEEDEDDAMMGRVDLDDTLANHVLRGVPPPPSSMLPHTLPRPLQPLPSPGHPHPPATDTSPSEIDEAEGCGGLSERRGGGDGNSTSAGGVSLSDDASILSLSDPNLVRSSPSTDCLPPRLDLDAAHSLASGDLDPDYYSQSPDLDLSHSLSIYETANSRASSSELAGVASFPLDPHPHPVPHRHVRAAEGAGEEVEGVRTSPGNSPDDLLYPDASG